MNSQTPRMHDLVSQLETLNRAYQNAERQYKEAQDNAKKWAVGVQKYRQQADDVAMQIRKELDGPVLPTEPTMGYEPVTPPPSTEQEDTKETKPICVLVRYTGEGDEDDEDDLQDLEIRYDTMEQAMDRMADDIEEILGDVPILTVNITDRSILTLSEGHAHI